MRVGAARREGGSAGVVAAATAVAAGEGCRGGGWYVNRRISRSPGGVADA